MSVYDTTRTRGEEVVIDSRTGSRPSLFSADCGPLVIQPGSEVWGVT